MWLCVHQSVELHKRVKLAELHTSASPPATWRERAYCCGENAKNNVAFCFHKYFTVWRRLLVKTIDVTHIRRVTFISSLAYFLSNSFLTYFCFLVVSSRTAVLEESLHGGCSWKQQNSLSFDVYHNGELKSQEHGILQHPFFFFFFDICLVRLKWTLWCDSSLVQCVWEDNNTAVILTQTKTASPRAWGWGGLCPVPSKL